MVVYVDLDQRPVVGCIGEGFESGTELPAGAAPGRPKVHKHGRLRAGLNHVCVEVIHLVGHSGCGT